MKKLFVFIYLFALILSSELFANNSPIDTIGIQNLKSGLELSKQWKYKTGDDHSWANNNFDDTNWDSLYKLDKEKDSTILNYKGITWFRVSFVIDKSIEGIPLALKMRTNGACDVFVDGRLIHSLGVVGQSESEQVSGFSLRSSIIPIPLNNEGVHKIAVRSSSFGLTGRFGLIKIESSLSIAHFNATVLSMRKALDEEGDITSMTIPMFFCGVFIVLSIFHMVLFLYYRKNRSNLYYSLFTLFIFIIFFSVYRTVSGTDLQTTKMIFTLGFWSFILVPLFFLGILYEVFYKRLLKMFWALSLALLGAGICLTIFDKESWGGFFLAAFLIGAFVETIRVFIRAWVKKREGSRIFIFGLLFPVIGVIAIGIIGWILRKSGFDEAAEKLSDHSGEFFLFAMLMSVSISMTIYLAREFARMNRKLLEQINEIKHLFNKTIEQEKEKKRILENQNEELERMVTLRTEEVVRQKALIELKNRDILDNLHYARRIQEAILPEIGLIYKTLRESFIIYLPKDIVSGDFYSFSQKDGKVIIAAADCTGHGVTGAFMSMIGSSVFNQIVNEKGITQPSLILDNLNTGITEALKQGDTDMNDGMDIALCTFDFNTSHLQFAGANRPLWIYRKGELIEIKPDKLAIGGFHPNQNATFTNHEMKLQQGDTLYFFTDGFADQFGGPNGRKFLSKHFREILSSIQDLSMREQEKHLNDIFSEWKGNLTQVDDVLVIGIRV